MYLQSHLGWSQARRCESNDYKEAYPIVGRWSPPRVHFADGSVRPSLVAQIPMLR